VRLCLYQLCHPEAPHPVLDLSEQPQLATIGIQPLNLAQYEQLLQGGTHGITPTVG
jgi:hypothetical protein